MVRTDVDELQAHARVAKHSASNRPHHLREHRERLLHAGQTDSHSYQRALGERRIRLEKQSAFADLRALSGPRPIPLEEANLDGVRRPRMLSLVLDGDRWFGTGSRTGTCSGATLRLAHAGQPWRTTTSLPSRADHP